MKSVPNVSYVNTRWVITKKDTGAWKARLVLVGCQDPQNRIRPDAPTGSYLTFHLTLLCGAQPGWKLGCHGVANAYLQSKGITRALILKIPQREPPPSMRPGELVHAARLGRSTARAPPAEHGMSTCETRS